MAAAPLVADEIAPTPFRTLDTSFIHDQVLDNGLTVVVIEAPTVPIVTMELAVRNGAFVETPATNGLAHLYEHMFFKANASIPSQEAYMARQREMGMIWNGTTSNERVNYFFTLPSWRVEEGLRFMADALLSPLFLQEELERELEVVIGEFDRAESSPFWPLFRAMDEQLWHRYPERKDALGSREVILSATPEQLEDQRELFYHPNNSLLVLAGDITAEQGFALAEEILGHWPEGPDPFERLPVPEHPPLEAPTGRVVTSGTQFSVVQIGWHGPDTRTTLHDTDAADVLSFIAGQTGSRFQANLVETGLALEAGVRYVTERYTGPIIATAVVPPGQEEEALRALHAEVLAFAEPDAFTDAQLRTAQTLLATQEIMAQQNVDRLAHTISYWWASADIDAYRTYVDRLNDVERTDLARLTYRFLRNRPFAAVVLTHPDVAAAQGLDDAWLQAIVDDLLPASPEEDPR